MTEPKKIKARPKLKPCPFCGAAPQYINEKYGCIIYCDNTACYVRVSTCKCYELADAIRLWNRRKTLDTGK